jgi:hypothetical protein
MGYVPVNLHIRSSAGSCDRKKVESAISIIRTKMFFAPFVKTMWIAKENWSHRISREGGSIGVYGETLIISRVGFMKFRVEHMLSDESGQGVMRYENALDENLIDWHTEQFLKEVTEDMYDFIFTFDKAVVGRVEDSRPGYFSDG